jgi:hypothetical protein
MDWGFAKPFSIGWYVVSDGSWGLPPGAILRYREWYGSNGKPNEGIRLESKDVAAGILEREAADDDQIDYRICDPAMYNRDNGPSIAEDFATHGIVFRRADNKRIPGWAQVRNRLSGDELGPRLFILETCRDLIRTLPTLQHHDKQPEDLDTDAEDHAADELRYACMSRPWVIGHFESTPPQRSNDPHTMTFNDLLAMTRKQRLAREARV